MERVGNRDPRLTQTICRPGEHVTIYEGGIVSLDEMVLIIRRLIITQMVLL